VRNVRTEDSQIFGSTAQNSVAVATGGRRVAVDVYSAPSAVLARRVATHRHLLSTHRPFLEARNIQGVLPGVGRMRTTRDLAGRNSTTGRPGRVPRSRVGNRHCLPRVKLQQLTVLSTGTGGRRQMYGRCSTKLES